VVAVHVTAPLAGTAVGLVDVPDPVFSTAMVGPGLAIEPGPGPSTVVAPVAGTLVKLKPHALVVLADGGRGVLVHLGIDTVKLAGEGFTLLASEGDTVEPGQPIVRWHPAEIAARGLSAVCPVVALDATAEAVADLVSGPVDVGAPLFTWN
jgi:PTS system N-acetylglucosamine-specific IIA component